MVNNFILQVSIELQAPECKGGNKLIEGKKIVFGVQRIVDREWLLTLEVDSWWNILVASVEIDWPRLMLEFGGNRHYSNQK